MAPLPAPATFEALGLSHAALASVAHAGFTAPTPIQALAIPPALAGRDVVGCAATGTGKTLAFALPMIERLASRPHSHGARALILAPTRELALQIAAEVDRFGRGRGFRSTAIIGGVALGPQAQELRRGGGVIVATPGRLVDHLERGSVRLGEVELLVLDEADRMLDMGFAPQLRRILAALPPRDRKPRQTLLFSATMAGEVAEFARGHLVDPVRVSANPSGTTASRAEQRVYLVPQTQKTALLLALLSEDADSTLVFTRTKRRADRLARALEGGGHKVARIHADRSQSQRKQALAGFSRGAYRVLVATDIAARGLDV
ncbi:MAG TPA: DEAD/DEAH box helicase, partial [Myxococcales bacterium]|nr:DEAD/DEAH box helicase [Myxococcales bacterium]